MMLRQFKSYCFDNQFFINNQKTLLAISGGVDSVVLAHLFSQQNLNFALAHCNFKLRGKESNEDELFVEQLAQQLAVPFFSNSFETEKIAQNNKESIQVAARNLRYDWLEKIRSEKGYDFIATAHHLNDSIETVFYNFAKGCGIRGLHGILPKNGKIIRPLLSATKAQIEEFAQENQLTWREDASNATDKYARNKIRHSLIPVLKELNPSFEQTAKENLNRLRETEELYDFALQKIKEEIIENREGELRISIQKLKGVPAPKSVLFEILKPFQFNNRQVDQILQSLDRQEETQVGKTFFSEEKCLLIDRDYLLVKKVASKKDTLIFIQADEQKIALTDHLISIKKQVGSPNLFSKDKNRAAFDFDKFSFPLTLRKWKIGDVFQPFGLQGKHQKVSDYFSNNKFSRFEKEETWILENQGEIVWIVGHRTDERYKITEETKNSLLFAVKKK